MDIDELLNRYFEGETSSEEERELRAFFTSGNVPDRLAVYTPMFTYLEEESRKERQPDEALIPIDEDILFMLDAEKVEVWGYDYPGDVRTVDVHIRVVFGIRYRRQFLAAFGA